MAQAQSSATAAPVITIFNVLKRIVAIGPGLLQKPLGVHYSAPQPRRLTAHRFQQNGVGQRP